MATVPKIQLRDGTGFVTSVNFTTNADTVTVSGQVDANTADIQVSFNGGDYVSDPNLVDIVAQAFVIPNPQVYPSGLPIDLGVNTILIRTVDIVGGVSSPASVLITRVGDADLTSAPIPTGIRVRRIRDAVQILVAKPQPIRDIILDDVGDPVLVTTDTATFLGFNFYASTSPAGASGYYKLNDKPVSLPSTFEEEVNLVVPELAVWDVGAGRTLRVMVWEIAEDGSVNVRLDAQQTNRIFSGQMRFESTLTNFNRNEYVVFTHDRAGGQGLINTDQFSAVSASDPLYYVVTGVFFDAGTNTEVETPYSQEVLGNPLVVDTTIRDLPGRTQSQIVTDYIDSVLRANPSVSVVPGSVMRDVAIDPFASEAERIWFVLDFIHRSQSFLTLLAVDNVSGDGTSDLVAGSAYKQALKAALGVQTDSSVQSLIDQQFDKLAANVGKTRLAGRQAVGNLTLFTRTRPSKDLQVPAGSFATSVADAATGVTSQRYRIGGSFVLSSSNADAYYNYREKRYEIRVPIVAEQAGSAGNVPAGAITSLVGVSGFQAVNEAALVFGTDRESNADLAARAMVGFASVDTGTENGYLATAAAKSGVLRSKLVKAGDPLMMRDYDPVRGRHIGGKVDLWVQGVLERQVQDRFAFTSETVANTRCDVVDPSGLVFRVRDSRVTAATPIISVKTVTNATRGVDYNVRDAKLVDFQTMRLSASFNDVSVTQPDDVVVATYRLQTQNRLYMTVQPVRHVVSVVGDVSGPLTPDVHYKLYKTEDPLLEGESTIARDYIAITPSGGIPGNSTAIDNPPESHVLVGSEEEPLNHIGVNLGSLRVFSADRMLEYSSSGATPDFNIIPGTATTAARMVRTAGSRIVSGQEISVDYSYDENFTVTYVVNDLLQQLQAVVDGKRHVTADVLVKQAVVNLVDIETTVQLKPGVSKDKTDPLVRNNVSLALKKRLIGQGLAQSNVDAAINDTTNIDFNILPMARMAYGDGSTKLRETVLSECVHVAALDGLSNVVTYLLVNPLALPTTDGGGLDTEHRGVFQDDVAMNLVGAATDIGSAPGQAFIVGAGGIGLSIDGYCDDETLNAEGYSEDEYAAERVRRTANRVLVSVRATGASPDNPTKHAYAVSYVVRGDSGSHDIDVSAIEAIDLGRFTITWNEGG